MQRCQDTTASKDSSLMKQNLLTSVVCAERKNLPSLSRWSRSRKLSGQEHFPCETVPPRDNPSPSTAPAKQQSKSTLKYQEIAQVVVFLGMSCYFSFGRALRVRCQTG